MAKGTYVSKAAAAVEQFRHPAAETTEKSNAPVETVEAVDAVESVETDVEISVENVPAAKPRNKGGRPYLGPVKRISLAVPLDLYEGVEDTASLFYHGSVTAYINDLIRRDLTENADKYAELKQFMRRH